MAKLADSLLKSVAIDLEYKRLVHDLSNTGGPQAVANLRLNVMMVADDTNTSTGE